MTTRIRTLQLEDIPALYDISCAVHLSALYMELIPEDSYERFKQVYTPTEAHRERFFNGMVQKSTDDNWKIWVAECQEYICGYAITHESDIFSQFTGLFVLENFQGKGTGKMLFQHALKNIRRPISLKVIASNARAKLMYEKAGFRVVKVLEKRFYGADMVHMYKY